MNGQQCLLPAPLVQSCPMRIHPNRRKQTQYDCPRKSHTQWLSLFSAWGLQFSSEQIRNFKANTVRAASKDRSARNRKLCLLLGIYLAFSFRAFIFKGRSLNYHNLTVILKIPQRRVCRRENRRTMHCHYMLKRPGSLMGRQQ